MGFRITSTEEIKRDICMKVYGKIEKIFYEYYDMLKNGGYFFIDDISHIPYLKKKERIQKID